MKLFVIIITILVNIAFSAERGDFFGAKNVEQMPHWFKKSFLELNDDLIEAQNSGKYIILYFHQQGCPYCEKLINDNFKNKQLVEEIRRDFEVIEINMWGDKEIVDFNNKEFSEKDYASFLRVQFTPTLFFLDNKGKTILRLDGYQSIIKMHKIIDFIVSNSYLSTSFAKFIANYKSGKNQPLTPLNYEEFFADKPYNLIRNTKYFADRYLAVFFEKSNCNTCDRMHKNIKKSKKIINMFKQMEVVQLNIGIDEKIITPDGIRTTSSQWYEKLKLTYKPAIVFFTKDGKEIIRKDAFFRQFHFESIIDYVLTDSYKNQPNFQRYIEHKADKIRAKGVNVDIWGGGEF